MSDEQPGVVTAHDQFEVDVRLRSGASVTLLIEDVQFLMSPHAQMIKMLRGKNPVVRHFFALQKSGPVEVIYNPGLASNAGYAGEEFALSFLPAMMLGKKFRSVDAKLKGSRTDVLDGRTGQIVPGYSYHALEKVKDSFGIVGQAGSVALHAFRGFEKTRAAYDDLIAWAAGLPGRGYYIVENGKPHVLPEIEHEIRYQDLVRVDG
ncbi:hypothetical protein ACF05L_15970 [Streptomyces bobili]|uniref:hypothetical protein n=1 Tax=Streptomyces bobili TaxID=67280 RepID=UPI0036F6AC28